MAIYKVGISTILHKDVYVSANSSDEAEDFVRRQIELGEEEFFSSYEDDYASETVETIETYNSLSEAEINANEVFFPNNYK